MARQPEPQRQKQQRDYSHVLSLLPEDVLLHVLATGTQRHLFGSVACVCKSWRDAVHRATSSVTLVLKSDAAAVSAALWLQRHALTLQELEITTAGVYSRHCNASTQLKLFQALNAAAGGPSGESDSEDEEEEDQERPCGSDSAEGDEDCHTAAASGAASERQQAAVATGPGAAAAARGSLTGQLQALQLRRLVANLRLAPADCAAVAALPAPGLQTLELHGSRTRRLTLDGVQSLAQLTQLTRLCLQHMRIGDDAAKLVAERLTGLAVLELSSNNIGPSGAAAVAEHLTRLRRLDISVNRIKDAGLSALCSSLNSLQALSIAGNVSFSTSSLQQLRRLLNLTSLHASSNALSNAGLAVVCSALPQLLALDAAANKISKADPLSCLLGLTSLTLSRNPLQISSTKVLTGLPNLQELVLFDAVSAKAVTALTGLSSSLTALTLGADPGLNPEGTKNLQLDKTRTCNSLFGGLAEAACKLRQLAVPCTGLGDAQAKAIGRLGSCLSSLNISYNCLSPSGLRFVRELQQLRRLELRAMRPELTDEAAAELQCCSKLELLDIAYNDLTSDGVKQLGSGKLPLQHLNLRSNVQVETSAIICVAPKLSCLTYLNLLEVGDGSGSSEFWPALPNLHQLVLGTQYEGSHASRSGRVMMSCGG